METKIHLREYFIIPVSPSEKSLHKGKIGHQINCFGERKTFFKTVKNANVDMITGENFLDGTSWLDVYTVHSNLSWF